jgi:hypothetical protein
MPFSLRLKRSVWLTLRLECNGDAREGAVVEDTGWICMNRNM